MPTEHIVRSYDEELRKLRDMVARMGGPLRAILREKGTTR